MNVDESIQKEIEEGKFPSGVDADAYRLIFRSLKKEPNMNLSADFAQRVSLMAGSRSKSFDWDKFFLFAGFGAFSIALIYAILATDFKFSLGAFQFLSDYSFLFIFAVAFITGAHWLEKKLFKNIHV